MNKWMTYCILLVAYSCSFFRCVVNQKNNQHQPTSNTRLKYEILKLESGESIEELNLRQTMGYWDRTELYSTKGAENLPKFLPDHAVV